MLIRSGLEAGGSPRAVTTVAAAAPQKRVVTTTAAAAAPTTTNAVAVKRFWTVQAGDTFGVISAKSGVPVTTIEQLNPTVRSTSLFIGEKIRLK
ncbi:MAG TPA: LysM domain-containing protein [Gaiellaceae bacterium]|nr:LysM domain-containing protein [Gaiellaceae bacterium]